MIRTVSPKFYATNPAVSVPCLRAMGSLLDKDRSKRIGAISFESFTSHPFFAEFDFEAMELKAVPPVFKPSSEKTNFDATYDLEELLLEEAPLEARARRQKPRAELREMPRPRKFVRMNYIVLSRPCSNPSTTRPSPTEATPLKPLHQQRTPRTISQQARTLLMAVLVVPFQLLDQLPHQPQELPPVLSPLVLLQAVPLFTQDNTRNQIPTETHRNRRANCLPLVLTPQEMMVHRSAKPSTLKNPSRADLPRPRHLHLPYLVKRRPSTVPSRRHRLEHKVRPARRVRAVGSRWC